MDELESSVLKTMSSVGEQLVSTVRIASAGHTSDRTSRLNHDPHVTPMQAARMATLEMVGRSHHGDELVGGLLFSVSSLPLRARSGMTWVYFPWKQGDSQSVMMRHVGARMDAQEERLDQVCDRRPVHPASVLYRDSEEGRP